MRTEALQPQCVRCCGETTVQAPVCRDCLATDLGQPEWQELWYAPERAEGEEPGVWQGFVIGEVLGSGGVGRVFRARQLHPPREVALKMLHGTAIGDKQARLRLLAEAEALAELDHPGILPLYDAGEADGQAWLAMKLAAGGTLAERMREWTGRWEACAALTAGLAEAVQHAHGRGVLHRDIKPANVLFDEAGRAFVADFSLAKWLSGRGSQTLTAAVLGTPAYMAPEVATQGAAAATAASDVYGLGAVLYELLSGVPPFTGPTPVEVARLAATEDVTPPRRRNAAIPRDLDAISLKALRREPHQRYITAQAMADDLQRWLDGKAVTARAPGAAERTVRWCRRHPLPAALTALVIAVCTVSSVMLWRAFVRTGQALKAAENRMDFMTQTLPAQLAPVGRLEVLDGVFADAASYYESMDGTAPDPGAAMARKSSFLSRWAQVLRQQGRSDEARAKAIASLAASEEAIRLKPAAPAALSAHAAAHRRIAELDIVSGDVASGFSHLEEAAATLATGLKVHSDLAELRVEQAEVLNEKGFAFVATGKPEAALAAYAEAESALRSAVISDSTSAITRRRHGELLLVSRSLRGEALLAAGRFPEAVITYEQHLAATSAACAAAPGDYALKRDRLVALNRLADALSRQNAPVDRIAALWNEQEQGAADLCAQDSGNLQWRADWGLAAISVARGWHLKGDATAAREWLEKALARLDGIPARAHNHVLTARANASLYLADNLHQSGDWTQGRERTLAAMEAAWAALADGAGSRDQHRTFVEERMRPLLAIFHAREPEKLAALIDGWITRAAAEAAGAKEPAASWWKLTEASLHRRAADRSRGAEATAHNLKALQLRAGVLSAGADESAAAELLREVISTAGKLGASEPEAVSARQALEIFLQAAPQVLKAGPESVIEAANAAAGLLRHLNPADREELAARAVTALFPQEPAAGSALAAAKSRLLSPP